MPPSRGTTRANPINISRRPPAIIAPIKAERTTSAAAQCLATAENGWVSWSHHGSNRSPVGWLYFLPGGGAGGGRVGDTGFADQAAVAIVKLQVAGEVGVAVHCELATVVAVVVVRAQRGQNFGVGASAGEKWVRVVDFQRVVA